MSHDPFIEAAALPSLGALRLLDAREQAAFDACHPADAVRAPVTAWEDAAKAGETSLENTTFWEGAIACLGVDGRTPTVIYDDGRMTEAARVWFILQYFGAAAFILDGGWPALQGNLPAASEPSAHHERFRARPASGPVGLVDRHAMRDELGTGVRILDARTQREFAGEDLRRNTRGGHLPGARLVSHASLIQAGRMKSAPMLRALFADAGLAIGDPVVTHCDGGGRAALAAAAAIRAGYDHVRAYYLSFADWAKDESCPIVRTDPQMP